MTKQLESSAPSVAGITIKKAQDMGEPNSILLYGREKVGKTTLMGSMVNVPGYERGVIIDCEKGATAIATNYPSVDVIPIEIGNINQLVDVVNAFLENENGIAERYDWVGLDTMSTASKWAIKALKARNKDARQAWGELNDWIMQVLWDMHEMKPLGITTFHTRTDEIELTKDVLTTPNVQGGARYSVASVPDLVGYVYVVDENDDTVSRVVSFEPTETRTGGNRFPQLPHFPFYNAKMENIYAMIRGELKDVVAAPKTKAEKAAEAAAEEPTDDTEGDGPSDPSD